MYIPGSSLLYNFLCCSRFSVIFRLGRITTVNNRIKLIAIHRYSAKAFSNLKIVLVIASILSTYVLTLSYIDKLFTASSIQQNEIPFWIPVALVHSEARIDAENIATRVSEK